MSSWSAGMSYSNHLEAHPVGHPRLGGRLPGRGDGGVVEVAAGHPGGGEALGYPDGRGAVATADVEHRTAGGQCLGHSRQGTDGAGQEVRGHRRPGEAVDAVPVRSIPLVPPEPAPGAKGVGKGVEPGAGGRQHGHRRVHHRPHGAVNQDGGHLVRQFERPLLVAEVARSGLGPHPLPGRGFGRAGSLGQFGRGHRAGTGQGRPHAGTYPERGGQRAESDAQLGHDLTHDRINLGRVELLCCHRHCPSSCVGLS